MRVIYCVDLLSFRGNLGSLSGKAIKLLGGILSLEEPASGIKSRVPGLREPISDQSTTKTLSTSHKDWYRWAVL